jgi:hypothetical protein
MFQSQKVTRSASTHTRSVLSGIRDCNTGRVMMKHKWPYTVRVKDHTVCVVTKRRLELDATRVVSRYRGEDSHTVRVITHTVRVTAERCSEQTRPLRARYSFLPYLAFLLLHPTDPQNISTTPPLGRLQHPCALYRRLFSVPTPYRDHNFHLSISHPSPFPFFF